MIDYEAKGAVFEAKSAKWLSELLIDGKAIKVNPSAQKYSKWDKAITLPCGLKFLWQDKYYGPYTDKDTGEVVDVNKIRRDQLASYFKFEIDSGHRMLMFCKDMHLYTMQDVLSLINETSADNCYNDRCFSHFPRKSGMYYKDALVTLNRENYMPTRLKELEFLGVY